MEIVLENKKEVSDTILGRSTLSFHPQYRTCGVKKQLCCSNSKKQSGARLAEFARTNSLLRTLL